MDEAMNANYRLNTPGIRANFLSLTQHAYHNRSRPDDSRITEEEEEGGISGAGAAAAGALGGAAVGAAAAGASAARDGENDFRLPPLQLGRDENELSLDTMPDTDRTTSSGPLPPPRNPITGRASESPTMTGDSGSQTPQSAGGFGSGAQTPNAQPGTAAAFVHPGHTGQSQRSAIEQEQQRTGSSSGMYADRNQQSQQQGQRPGSSFAPNDSSRQGSRVGSPLAQSHGPQRQATDSTFGGPQNELAQASTASRQSSGVGPDPTVRQNSFGVPESRQQLTAFGVPDGHTGQSSTGDADRVTPLPPPQSQQQQQQQQQSQQPQQPRATIAGVAGSLPQQSPKPNNPFHQPPYQQYQHSGPPQQQPLNYSGSQGSIGQQGRNPFQQQPYHKAQEPVQHHRQVSAGSVADSYSTPSQTLQALGVTPERGDSPSQVHNEGLRDEHGQGIQGGAQPRTPPVESSALPPRRASTGTDLQGAPGGLSGPSTGPEMAASGTRDGPDASIAPYTHGGQGAGGSGGPGGFAAVAAGAGAGLVGAGVAAAALHHRNQHQQQQSQAERADYNERSINNNSAPSFATSTSPSQYQQNVSSPTRSPPKPYHVPQHEQQQQQQQQQRQQPYHSPPPGSSAAPAAVSPVASPVATQSKGSSSSPRQSDTIHQPRPQRSSGMSNEASSPALSPNLRDEPAALYLMNMVEEPEQAPQDAPSSQQRQLGRGPGSLDQHQQQRHPSSPPTYQSQGNVYNSSPSYNPSGGRRPSGARAIPTSNHSHLSNEPTSPVSPADHNRVENGRFNHDGPMQQQQQQLSQQNGAGRAAGATVVATTVVAAAAGAGAANGRDKHSAREEDDDADAAAYLAYAEQPLPQPPQQQQSNAGPVQESEGRSSFAPSKAAAERRANAEAAAQSKQHIMNVPGGGRRKDKWQQPRGDYNPDDESDEDEDEDEDDHDPPSSPPGPSQQQRQGGYNAPPHAYNGGQNHYQQPPYHQQQHYPQQQYQQPPYQQQQHQQQRGPLPPVPRGGGRDSMYGDELAPPSTLRGMSIHDDVGRSRSSSPPAPHRHLPHPNMPPQLAAGVAPAPKHNIWNANFAQEHGLQKKDGKFVELEEPAVQLTKAFTPGGLLQAGMQDKADRSARRQEEVARETGSALLNIPEKPPPPSTGLVGAVAAHERDRKNAGGIGATLTDRDRERRLAEDRQRKIEELQRQQMESMSQYGGGFPPYGYGMPPQMMGMGGYPVSEAVKSRADEQYGGGMMNPQAQQQAMMAAQMAYQQTIMAMSQAGSQMGDNDGASVAGGRSPSPSASMRMPGMPGAPGFFPGAGGYGYGMPTPSMYGFPMGMPPMGMQGMPPPMGLYPGQPGQQGRASPGFGRPGSMTEGNSPMHTGAGSYGGDREREAS